MMMMMMMMAVQCEGGIKKVLGMMMMMMMVMMMAVQCEGGIKKVLDIGCGCGTSTFSLRRNLDKLGRAACAEHPMCI